MNKSFPKTQALIQSVQRQVQKLVDSNMVYNVKVTQDWHTLRWSRITWVNDPAATAKCVGISNPDRSNNWGNKTWTKQGLNTDLSKSWICQPRRFNSSGHVLHGACSIDIKKHIRIHLNGLDPQFFEARSYSCQCSTMLIGHRKRRVMFTQSQRNGRVLGEVQAFKLGHWLFWGQASEYTWWKRNPNKPSGKWDIIALKTVNFFSTHAPHQVFPATAPLSPGQLRKQ